MARRNVHNVQFKKAKRNRLSVTMLEDRCNPAPIGGLDPTFGDKGIATAADLLGNGTAFFDSVQTTEGKFIAVGGDANNNFVVARFNSDGSLDQDFGTNGIVTSKFQNQNSAALSVAVDTDDGTIYIAGFANDFDDQGLAKISANGNDVTSVVNANVGLPQDIAFNSATNQLYLVDNFSGQLFIKLFDDNLAFVNLNNTVFDSNDPETNARVTLAADGTVFAVATANNQTGIGVARLPADLSTIDTKVYDLNGTQNAGGITISSATGQVFIGASVDGNIAVIRINDPKDIEKGNTKEIGAGFVRAIGVDAFNRPVLTGESANGVFVARLTGSGELKADDTFAPDGIANLKQAAGSNGFGIFVDNASGKITLAGSDGGKAAAYRVIGATGLPTSVIASGQPSGNGVRYNLDPATFASLSNKPVDVELNPKAGGSVRVAQADVNGDGVADLIVASGPGGGAVRVVDGRTSNEIANFQPFPGFTGGLWIAAGDFTGDGMAEIVAGPDVNGTPVVAIFSGADVIAKPDNPADYMRFIGLIDHEGKPESLDIGINGVRVAVGDVNGDGVADLVVGAGIKGGPRITVIDGLRIRDKTADDGIKPLANFFVFEERLRDGAFVAVGDINGDGFGDIIAGGGPSGGLRIRIMNGTEITNLGVAFGGDTTNNGGTINNFFVNGDEKSRTGIRVSVADVDGDGLADLVTGSGNDAPSEVRVFTGALLKKFPSGTADPKGEMVLDPMFGALPDGVFVG
ncbi:MAG: FG-GAP-like repeat-containing protein [Bacteroidales bacterium]|nr:FG-GAP-like repeat-containing protein [Bacteroidales bacterium]